MMQNWNPYKHGLEAQVVAFIKGLSLSLTVPYGIDSITFGKFYHNLHKIFKMHLNFKPKIF